MKMHHQKEKGDETMTLISSVGRRGRK